MFVTCGIWCLADVSSVSPSSEQTPGPSSEGLTQTLAVTGVSTTCVEVIFRVNVRSVRLFVFIAAVCLM